jgi:hypothetical protein
MVVRIAVIRATTPTATGAKGLPPKRDSDPTLTAPFSVPKMMTGRSIQTLLEEYISSAFR